MTKHHVKKEDTPSIPYNHPAIASSENIPLIDIKPFLNHPYYANPPWLNQHDYYASYYQQQQQQQNLGQQYSNYLTEAQSHPPNGALPNHHLEISPVPSNEQLVMSTTSDVVEVEEEPTANHIKKTDENANNVKMEGKNTETAEKKPPMTAQVSFEDNHVRIVFTRAINIHVVEVPFPDI